MKLRPSKVTWVARGELVWPGDMAIDLIPPLQPLLRQEG